MTDLILRDYQVADITRLRNAYSHGMKAVIYQLATGGGKTVVFSHVVKGAVAKGRRVLVLVHRRELIKQASAKLTDLGVAHGIMAAGQDRDHDAQVIIASIQTVANRTLPDFGLIVIDEAHHARATTWQRLIASQADAKILGVTATPAPTDGRGLGVEHGGLFDAIVCGPMMSTLVAAGHLVPTRCLVPGRTIDTTGLRKVAGDFAGGEALAERASVVTGDAIREYRTHCTGRSAIAFCVTVAHAEQTAAAFRDAGFRSECVHGGTPKDERDALIASLGNGGIDVLTSCEIISEGLDVPSVGAVILLRPTASLIMCLQQIGRGMRPAPGKDCLIVLDHAGNTVRHGAPEEDRIWSLAGVEKTPAVRAPANPETKGFGKPREIIEVDGVLVERTAAQAAASRWASMSLGAFKRHPRTNEQIIAFGWAHGYKPGWAFYFRKDQAVRFGHGAVEDAA